MENLEFIHKIIKNLLDFNCKHPSINRYEKENYCPDCGKRIKLHWKTLRCKQCNSLIMPQVNKFGDISPLKKFCANCGSNKWFIIQNDSLNYSESFYAISRKEAVEENNNSSVLLDEENHNSTEIRIDNPNRF